MTNEEAIKLLSQIMDALLASNSWLPSTDNPIKESFGMAINALTAQPETHEERTETHACDLISRQAVIEINRSYHGQMPNEVNHRIWKEINELPPAQPELPEWAQKVEEYRKSAPSFVRNQLVWALYQTWKEYDGRLVHQRGKENRWLNI